MDVVARTRHHLLNARMEKRTRIERVAALELAPALMQRGRQLLGAKDPDAHQARPTASGHRGGPDVVPAALRGAFALPGAAVFGIAVQTYPSPS